MLIKKLKFNWLKLFSVALFFLLIGSYTHIFAIGQPYNPGETLDPACSPEEVNCTVLITGGSSVWTTNGNDIYYNTGNVGIGLISPNNLFQVEDLINFDNTDYNTKLGYQAGKNIISGSQANTFVGYESGFSGIGNSNADYNTAIGNSTLYSNTAGYNNAAIGSYSLYYNTTGYLNSAVGALSLVSNTTGINNTAMGADAMYYNTSGYGNSSYGVGSLMYNVGNHRSTAIGLDAMLYADNRSVGRETFNTALGYEALRGTTTAANNTGQYNTAIGDSALLSNSSGYNNSAVGYGSLYSNTTGYYNTALGYQSGRYISDGLTVNDTSDFGVYLGHNTKAGANNNQNEIVIGYDAIGNGSNTATIGNTSLLRTYLTGVNLKAGTATTGTAPLKLTAGTNLTTAETGAMEYDGTNLYFTPSGTTRRTIAYTDSNITGTAGGLSSTLGVSSGGTGLATVAAGSVLGYNTLDTASAITSTSGTRVLTNTNGTITWETASGGMVYPGAGIPNSTGSAWGTSYTTTGSGTVLALATTPTFTTNITTPLIIGGTTTTSPLTLRSTSGVGTTGADIIFQTGNNGATEAMRILNNGNVGIGATSPFAKFEVQGGFYFRGGSGDVNSSGGNPNSSDAATSQAFYDGTYLPSDYTLMYSLADVDGNGIVSLTDTSLMMASFSGGWSGQAPYFINNMGKILTGRSISVRNIGISTDPTAASGDVYLGISSSTSNNLIIANSGNVGIGQTTPTSYLHIKAGTATAGTAPLKLTAGTNLTTTEAGAIEYDGTHLYFTATNGGTRYQLDQQASGGMVYPGAGIPNSTGSAWGTSYTTTGSGTVLALATTPTFTTNITTPLIIGGTTTTSPLTLRSTSGVGTTGADIIFQTGNNGATEAMRILNNGRVGIGTASPNSLFQVSGLISFDTTEYNTEIGRETGLNLVAGAQYNTFLGHQAGRGGNTGGTDTADYNTAIGYRAFYANTTGGSNTAIGNYALTSNTTGDSNSAIGTRALYSNTGGYNNTANGMYALYSNLTGNYNNANGQYSLFSNTTGGYNTAFGNYSLNANVAGSNATAFGYNAMQYSNSTDTPFINYNIAIGYEALRGTTTAANNTGNYNTAIGYQSSFGYETAARNTTIGYFAGRNNVSGNNNLLIGYQAGDALSSGSTNIALGYDVDLPSATADNQMTIGNLIFATGGFGTGTTIGTGNVGIANNSPSYRLHVGNSSVAGIVARFENGTGTCDINPTTASLVCSSDINLKKNIMTLDDMEFTLETLSDLSEKSILEKLGYLTPVLYNWNNEEDGSLKHIGFIAQEVEQVFPEIVSTDINNDQKSIAYTNLIPYTIQAIQEMDLKVKDLDQKINNLSVPMLMKEFFGGVLIQIADGVGYLKNIVVENIKVGSPEKRTGITLYDEETGEPYCLSISGGQTKTKIGECGVVTPSSEIIIEKEEIEITEIEDDIEIISNEILVEEIKEVEQKELSEIDENIIKQNEYIDEETNPQNIPQTDNKEEEQDPTITVDN